jgi:hypothetical protein
MIEKHDCGGMVYRNNWPDTCRNSGKTKGVLTLDGSGRRVAMWLCGVHAAEATRRNGRLSTQNQRIEPQYPYIASGTWEPVEPEARP